MLAMCRSYANAIVDLLDADHQLFGQRIISQGAAGDGAQQDLSKHLMQVLCCAAVLLCCALPSWPVL